MQRMCLCVCVFLVLQLGSQVQVRVFTGTGLIPQWLLAAGLTLTPLASPTPEIAHRYWHMACVSILKTHACV